MRLALVSLIALGAVASTASAQEQTAAPAPAAMRSPVGNDAEHSQSPRTERLIARAIRPTELHVATCATRGA